MTAAARFTKNDVKRAVTGVLEAGQHVRKIEIDRNGKIIILTGRNATQEQDDGEWGDLE